MTRMTIITIIIGFIELFVNTVAAIFFCIKDFFRWVKQHLSSGANNDGEW